jgi:signal peptidase I
MAEPTVDGPPLGDADPFRARTAPGASGDRSDASNDRSAPDPAAYGTVPPLSGPELTRPDDESPQVVTRRHRRQASRRRNVIEWVLVIVGAILVAVLVRTFLVQAFRIPSESMSPTLEKGDRVIVNRLSYKLHDVNRGDIVVFSRPPGLPAGADQPEDLIKRVIALPGETVQTKDGSIYIDNRKLNEPYLPKGTSSRDIDTPVTVPAGHVWVMGDNRANSADSRVFGPIDTDTIVGRAFLRIWPLNRLGTL